MLRLRRGGVTSGDAIGWDPDAGRIDAPALEGVDAVVHLAGEGIATRRWTDEQKRRIRDSRVRGTAVLAGRGREPGAQAARVRLGIGDRLLRRAAVTRCSPEQSAPGDDFLAQVCVAWEAETAPAAEAGVRTVLTRTGIVLDAHGGALKAMLLPFKLGIGGRQGTGKQWMSWIALADEVGAIRFAIDNETLRGPVNLVAPNPVTNAEFSQGARPRPAPADDSPHADAPVEAALRRASWWTRCCS